MRCRIDLPVLVLLAPLLGSDCGGDDAVSIDKIPPDKKLIDLDPGEQQGVCDWGSALARQKLPAPGTKLDCGGVQLTFNGAMSCSATPAGCSATLQQWQVCLPSFLDGIAEDPCLVWRLSFSVQDVADYIESRPGCAGLGPCATAMR